MTTRTCELILEEGDTQKLWSIEIRGRTRTLRYGSAGKKGQVRTKEFDSEKEAEASFEKLVADKLAKGYRRADAPAGQAGPDDGAPPKDSDEHTPSLAPSREFDLMDNDWLRVGWRGWHPQAFERRS